MNRGLFIWIMRGVLFSLIVLVDLVIWRRQTGLALLADPTLLLVMVATTFQGWRSGLLAAGLAAWGTSLFSTFPVWVHPSAWLAVVAVLWGTSRRMLTTRSTASFLGLGAISVATYALTVAGLLGLAHLLVPGSPIPDWPRWWTPAITRVITHPLLAWVIWQLTDRSRRYTTARTSLEQPF